jgi:hypothetical protein
LELAERSIHDLRSIAQGYGIANLFQLDKPALLQQIRLKQQDMQPKTSNVPEVAPYDGRLFGDQPLETSEDNLREVLQEHISRGLKLDFLPPDAWRLRIADREDTGTLRQPLFKIVQAADNLLRAK